MGSTARIRALLPRVRGAAPVRYRCGGLGEKPGSGFPSVPARMPPGCFKEAKKAEPKPQTVEVESLQITRGAGASEGKCSTWVPAAAASVPGLVRAAHGCVPTRSASSLRAGITVCPDPQVCSCGVLRGEHPQNGTWWDGGSWPRGEGTMALVAGHVKPGGVRVAPSHLRHVLEDPQGSEERACELLWLFV